MTEYTIQIVAADAYDLDGYRLPANPGAQRSLSGQWPAAGTTATSLRPSF